MLTCKPSSIPMLLNLNLCSDSCTLLADPGIYKCLIGQLLYLTICHSDICYYVHKLSQYIANPQSAHMEVATIFL